MSLLLTELTPEQRQLPPLKVKKQLDDVANNYEQQALLEHQKKYGREFYNSVPPEKIMEVIQQVSGEMDAMMKKARAMRYPIAP